MKKYLILVVTFLSVASVQAQNIRTGFKIGGNLASLRNTGTNNDFSYKLKFHGGLVFNWGFSDLLSIQPEVVYSQKGFEYKNASVSSEGKVNYIDVPLLLKVDTGTLFFEGGPQLSFLTASKLKSGGTETDTKNWTKSTAFGVAAGVGAHVGTGTFVSLRYLTDLSEPYARVLNKPTEARNVVFQLSLGYLLSR
ncbi:PorT family protein [Adhaeribacter swui]|uniref:PorT family protein n=1 Tax=Adhaeribacter swui TaxID=2086471 RepID=A0A7G7G9V9_9BACT|nr:porin family protein [Adhaeribacter swui]QNF33943.1 PorT family protein [Adhaeribacter swui]